MMMKNVLIIKKNRWVLGLVIVIILFIGGIFYFQNNSSLIKSSAVWNSSNMSWLEKWNDCKNIDCNLEIMEKDGATLEARNFIKLLPDPGYLNAFQEKGKVDLGTVSFPGRANTNDVYYLLNGSPRLVSTEISQMDTSELGNQEKEDPLYSGMIEKYPKIYLWQTAKTFVEKKSLPNNGEEYIFKYDFVNNCHACSTEYSAKIGFDFSSSGKFSKIKFIQIDKDSLLFSLKNATYKIRDNEIKLTNGSYSGVSPYGVGDSRNQSEWDLYTDHFDLDTQNIAYNNTDNNKADRVALIIIENNGGGTGHFHSLVLMNIENNQPKFVADVFIDDRPVINSISITGDKIIVSAVIHDINNPKDSLCCPTLEKTLVYKLTSDNKLEEQTNEIVNISDNNYEGDKLEYDLDNNGKKEIIFQQITGTANGVRLIVADESGRVLFSTLIRAGKIEIKDNSVFHTSYVQDQESITKISWDGNSWISEKLK